MRLLKATIPCDLLRLCSDKIFVLTTVTHFDGKLRMHVLRSVCANAENRKIPPKIPVYNFTEFSVLVFVFFLRNFIFAPQPKIRIDFDYCKPNIIIVTIKNEIIDNKNWLCGHYWETMEFTLGALAELFEKIITCFSRCVDLCAVSVRIPSVCFRFECVIRD